MICANYLSLLIISRMEKPIYHIHESPLLHKVSYLGCAKHLQLLLKVCVPATVTAQDLHKMCQTPAAETPLRLKVCLGCPKYTQ